MTYTPLLWVLAGAVLHAPKTTLAFAEGAFIVTRGKTAEHVPIDPPKPSPRTKVEYRSDQKFVIWDERGLTIRSGSHAKSTRLRAIPTSPRLRTHDAIVGTLDAVHAGRKLEAAAVSGSRRFGKTVYFVLRWEDRPGQPWLEALVSVDLSESDPAAKAIAVLPGLSFSTVQIADNLVAGPKGVSVLIHEGTQWGQWSYRPDTQQTEFHILGEGVKYAAAVSADVAAFIEKTEHGSFAAGTVDLVTGARADAAESPTRWRMLDAKAPPVAEGTNDGGGHVLAELTSGAVFDLPEGADVRRAKDTLVIWEGGKRPTKAWLYDPTTWKALAWWRSPGAG
ncbi:MAG TPA: hypothetical protein VKT78_02395 [Fimbriimonadaceae bacterium]|nr:hypothetical protein [Fimbriimonadaceae bacterium]